MADAQKLQPPALPHGPSEWTAQYQEQLNNVHRLFYNRLTGSLNALLSVDQGGRALFFPYGSFYSSQDQLSGNTTTAYRFSYDQTSFSQGVSIANQTAVFRGSISNGAGGAGTILNISTLNSGTVYPSMALTGSGVTAGTYIVSQTSGTPGGVGLYVVNTSQYRAFSAFNPITGTIPSKIVFSIPGLYNIQFSAQIINPDSQEHDVEVWFAQNSVNIADSNSQWSAPSKHGSIDGHLIATLNFFVQVAAEDYIELLWRVSDANIKIKQYAAASSPTRPAIPSIILTANFVSNVR